MSRVCSTIKTVQGAGTRYLTGGRHSAEHRRRTLSYPPVRTDATPTYDVVPISTVVSLYVVSPAGVPGFTPSTDMLVQ